MPLAQSGLTRQDCSSADKGGALARTQRQTHTLKLPSSGLLKQDSAKESLCGMKLHSL